MSLVPRTFVDVSLSLSLTLFHLMFLLCGMVLRVVCVCVDLCNMPNGRPSLANKIKYTDTNTLINTWDLEQWSVDT